MDNLKFFITSGFVLLVLGLAGQTYQQPVASISSGAENSTNSAYSNFGVLGNVLVLDNASGGGYNTYSGFINTFEITVGVENVVYKLSAKIYPNPAYDKVYIGFVNLPKDYSYSFHNNLGQLVLRKKVDELKEEIDLTGLANGVYYLKIYNKQFTKTEKIIVR